MGAWVEISDTVQLSLICEQSHPMWVRGLKLSASSYIPIGSAPVAPYVGAWVEIRVIMSSGLNLPLSHPMWVRGLKSKCRTVWKGNHTSHPMRVRGLKYRQQVLKVLYISRTLCGCVG